MPARIPGKNALYRALLQELQQIEPNQPVEDMLSVEASGSGYIVSFGTKSLYVERLIPLPVRVKSGSRAEPDFGIIASWGPKSSASVAIHPEIHTTEDENLTYVRAVSRLASVLHTALREGIPVPAAIQREAQNSPTIEGRPSNFVTLVPERTESQATRIASAYSIVGKKPVETVRAIASLQPAALRQVQASGGTIADIRALVDMMPATSVKEREGVMVLTPTYIEATGGKTTKHGSIAGRQGVSVFTIDIENGRARLRDEISSLEKYIGRPVYGPGVVSSFDPLASEKEVVTARILYTALPGYPGAGLTKPSFMYTQSGRRIIYGSKSMVGGKVAPLRNNATVSVNTLMARIKAIAADIESGKGELAKLTDIGVMRGAGEDTTIARFDFGELGEVTAEARGIKTGYAALRDFRLAVPYYYDVKTGLLYTEEGEGRKSIVEYPGAADLFSQLYEHGIRIVPSEQREISLRASIFKEGPAAIKQGIGFKTAPAPEPFEIESATGAMIPRSLMPTVVTSELKNPSLAAVRALGYQLKTFNYDVFVHPDKYHPQAVQKARARMANLYEMAVKSGAVPDGIAIDEIVAQHMDIFESYFRDGEIDTLKRIIAKSGGVMKRGTFNDVENVPYIDFGTMYQTAAAIGADPSIVSRYEQAVGDIYLRNVTNTVVGQIKSANSIEEAMQIAGEAVETYGVSPIPSEFGLAIRFGRPGIYKGMLESSPLTKQDGQLFFSVSPPEITDEMRVRSLVENIKSGRIKLSKDEQSEIAKVFGGDIERYARAVVSAQNAVDTNIEFTKWAFGGNEARARAWAEALPVAGYMFKTAFMPTPEYWGEARLNLEDLTSLYALASGHVNEEFGKQFILNLLGSDISGGPFAVSESNAYRGWRSMIAGYVATARGWQQIEGQEQFGAGIRMVDSKLASRLIAARGAVEQASSASYKELLAEMQNVLGEGTNLLAFRLGGKTVYMPSPNAIIGASYDAEHLLGEYGAQGLLRHYTQVIDTLLEGATTGNEAIAKSAYEIVSDFYQRQLSGKVSGSQLNRLLGTMASSAGAYSARYQISYNLRPAETYIPRQRLHGIARTYGFRNAAQMFRVAQALGGSINVVGLRQPNIGFVPVPMRVLPTSEMEHRYIEAYKSLGYKGQALRSAVSASMAFANTMQLVGPGIAEAGQGDYDYDPLSVIPMIPRMSRELINAIDKWRKTQHKQSLDEYIVSTIGDKYIPELNEAREYLRNAQLLQQSFETTEDFVRGTVPRIDAAAFSEFTKSLTDEMERYSKLQAIASGEQMITASGYMPRDIGEALSQGWRGKGEAPMGVTYNARRMMLLSMLTTGTPRARWLAGYRATTPLYQHTIDIESTIRGGLVNFAYPWVASGEYIGTRAPQINIRTGSGSIRTIDLNTMTRYVRSLPQFAEHAKTILTEAASLLASDLFPSQADIPEGFKSRSGPTALTSLIGGHLSAEKYQAFHDAISQLYEHVFSSPDKIPSERMLTSARARAINIAQDFIEKMTPEERVSSPAMTMFFGTLFRQVFAGNENARAALYQMIDWVNDENVPQEMKSLFARSAIVGAAQHVWSKHADVTEMPKIAGVVQRAVEALGGVGHMQPELQWIVKALMAEQVPITDPYAGERSVGLHRLLTSRGEIPVRHLAGLISGHLFQSEQAQILGRALGVDVRTKATKAMLRGKAAEEALFQNPSVITSALALSGVQGDVIEAVRQTGGMMRVRVPFAGGSVSLRGIADMLAVSRDANGNIVGGAIFDVKAPADNKVPAEVNPQYLLQTVLYEKMIAASTPEDLRNAFPDISDKDAARIIELARQGNLTLGLTYATKSNGQWSATVRTFSDDELAPWRALSLQDLLSVAAENWPNAGLPTTQTEAVEFLKQLQKRGVITVSGLDKVLTSEHVIDQSIERILRGEMPKPEMRSAIKATLHEKKKVPSPRKEAIAEHAKQAAEEAVNQTLLAQTATGGGGDGRKPPEPPQAPPQPEMPEEWSGKEIGESIKDAIGEGLKAVIPPIMEGVKEMLLKDQKVFPVGFGRLGKHAASLLNLKAKFDEAIQNAPISHVKSAYGRAPKTIREWFEAAAQSAARIVSGRATKSDKALLDSGFLQSMYSAASAISGTAINELSRLTDTDKDLFIARFAKLAGISEEEAFDLLGGVIETESGGLSPVAMLGSFGGLFKDKTARSIPKSLQRAIKTVASPSWRRATNNAIGAILSEASALGVDSNNWQDVVIAAFEKSRAGFESDEEAAAARRVLEEYARLTKMPAVRQFASASEDDINAAKRVFEEQVEKSKTAIPAATRRLYAAYKKYIGDNLDAQAQEAISSMRPDDLIRAAIEIGDDEIASRLVREKYDYTKLPKSMQRKLFSHVKRQVAISALRGIDEAQPIVSEYEQVLTDKRVAERVAIPAIETAAEIASATSEISPQEASAESKDVVPPSVIEAHKSVASASQRVTALLNKYHDVLGEAIQQQQEHNKVTKETAEKLVELRKQIAHAEGVKAYYETLAKEREAMFAGDTEKAARLRTQRAVIAAQVKAGSYKGGVSGLITAERELGIDAEGNVGGFLGSISRFARGFALFYAMRIFRIATGALHANMQEGEAWGRAIGKGVLAAGGPVVETAGEEAARIRGSGAAPYAGLHVFAANASRTLGPITAMVRAGFALPMSIGVMRAMGLTSGIFAPVAGLGGATLAALSGGIAALAGIGWLYGTSQDDLLAGKLAASWASSSIWGRIEQGWLGLSAWLFNRRAGYNAARVADAITNGAEGLQENLMPQYYAAMKRIAEQNEQMRSIGAESVAYYASRAMQAGLMASPSIVPQASHVYKPIVQYQTYQQGFFAQPIIGQTIQEPTARRVDLAASAIARMQSVRALAWARERKLPLEATVWSLLPRSATVQQALLYGERLGEVFGYGESPVDITQEQIDLKLMQSIIGNLPDAVKKHIASFVPFSTTGGWADIQQWLREYIKSATDTQLKFIRRWSSLYSAAEGIGATDWLTQQMPTFVGAEGEMFASQGIGASLANLQRLGAMLSSAGYGYSAFSAIRQPFLSASYAGQINMLSALQWRPIQATMFAYSAQMPQLATVDVSRTGTPTGLPLWTTTWQLPGISAQQLAQQAWGTNWLSGDVSGIRQAMVSGGWRAVHERMLSLQMQQGIEQANLAAARARLQYVFSTGNGLEAYGSQYAKPFSWSIAGIGGYSGLAGFWGYEDAMVALQRARQQYQFGLQERRMSLSEQNWQYIFGLNQQQFAAQQQYTLSMWNTQDTQRALQFAWRISDIRENMAYATGRQRILLERQLRRETVMHALSDEQIENQRKYQRQLWDIQKHRFEEEERHHRQIIQLQRDEFEKTRAFYNAQMKMEDRYRALRRKMLEEQYKLTQAQIGLSNKWRKIMQQAQKDMQKVREMQEDQLGKAKALQALYPTLLDYLKQIGVAFNEKVIAPLAKLLNIDTDTIKQHATREHKQLPIPRAVGGFVPPGEHVVHAGEVLVRSHTPIAVINSNEADDYMRKYYSTESFGGNGSSTINATITVVLATDEFRRIVREVIHEEIGTIH